MIVGPRVLVTLQSATETKNPSGHVSRSWSDVGSMRAVLVTMSGSESERWSRMNVFATHKLLVDKRYDFTPTEKYRVTRGSSTYEVVFIKSFFGRGTNRWEMILKETL